jgi:hypothetical protein
MDLLKLEEPQGIKIRHISLKQWFRNACAFSRQDVIIHDWIWCRLRRSVIFSEQIILLAVVFKVFSIFMYVNVFITWLLHCKFWHQITRRNNLWLNRRIQKKSVSTHLKIIHAVQRNCIIKGAANTRLKYYEIRLLYRSHFQSFTLRSFRRNTLPIVRYVSLPSDFGSTGYQHWDFHRKYNIVDKSVQQELRNTVVS